MRRSRLVAGLLAAALLLGTPWWGPKALRPLKFFGLRRVVVEGARYLSPSAVVEAMKLPPGASVFEDLGVLAARVHTAGGIEDVAISRRLPGTLVVRVRETEPVALASGPSGLVPVGRDGTPLPYAVPGSPVDVPIVPDADRRLTEALAAVRAADASLYREVTAARAVQGEIVLDLDGGRIRLPMPVSSEVVARVAAVRRDLGSRRFAWRELDGRFGGWVVVRRGAGQGSGVSSRPAPGA